MEDFLLNAAMIREGGRACPSLARRARGKIRCCRRDLPVPGDPLPFPPSLPLSVVLFLLLLAPAVGSFLGVLVDRLPRGEDIIRAPSRCRSCGARLGVWDLLPLIGFVLRRGRCRYCGAAIPPFSLYLEILATGAALLALAAGGGGSMVLFSCLFLWLLLALGSCDLIWLRLPDPLTGALALLLFGWGIWGGSRAPLPELPDLTGMLWGAALGMGSFLALRLGYQVWRGREGLGLGDVKLMAGLGAYAGVFDLALLVLMAALMGLVGGAVMALRSGMSGAGRAAALAQQALPFGTALCASAALLWLLRALAIVPS